MPKILKAGPALISLFLLFGAQSSAYAVIRASINGGAAFDVVTAVADTDMPVFYLETPLAQNINCNPPPSQATGFMLSYGNQVFSLTSVAVTRDISSGNTLLNITMPATPICNQTDDLFSNGFE